MGISESLSLYKIPQPESKKYIPIIVIIILAFQETDISFPPVPSENIPIKCEVRCMIKIEDLPYKNLSFSEGKGLVASISFKRSFPRSCSRLSGNRRINSEYHSLA
jgi:hypothetical protein